MASSIPSAPAEGCLCQSPIYELGQPRSYLRTFEGFPIFHTVVRLIVWALVPHPVGLVYWGGTWRARDGPRNLAEVLSRRCPEPPPAPGAVGPLTRSPGGGSSGGVWRLLEGEMGQSRGGLERTSEGRAHTGAPQTPQAGQISCGWARRPRRTEASALFTVRFGRTWSWLPAPPPPRPLAEPMALSGHLLRARNRWCTGLQTGPRIPAAKWTRLARRPGARLAGPGLQSAGTEGPGGEAAAAPGGHERGGVLGACASPAFVGWMQRRRGFYLLVPECWARLH